MDELDAAMQPRDDAERQMLSAGERALAPLIAALRALDLSRVPAEANAVFSAPPADVRDA